MRPCNLSPCYFSIPFHHFKGGNKNLDADFKIKYVRVKNIWIQFLLLILLEITTKTLITFKNKEVLKMVWIVDGAVAVYHLLSTSLFGV